MINRGAIVSYKGQPFIIIKWPECYTKEDLLEWYCTRFAINRGHCTIDHNAPIELLIDTPTRDYAGQIVQPRSSAFQVERIHPPSKDGVFK